MDLVNMAKQVMGQMPKTTMDAIDYLNSAVGRGVAGFQNPQAPSGNVVQQALDQVPLLRNIRGFNEGMFGQQAVNQPAVGWGLDTGTPLRTGVLQKVGVKGENMNPIEILVMKRGGQVVRSKTYPNQATAQKAFERMVVNDDEIAIPREVMQ